MPFNHFLKHKSSDIQSNITLKQEKTNDSKSFEKQKCPEDSKKKS